MLRRAGVAPCTIGAAGDVGEYETQGTTEGGEAGTDDSEVGFDDGPH